MPAGGAGLDDLYASGRAPATWPKPPVYQPIGVSSWVNAVDRRLFSMMATTRANPCCMNRGRQAQPCTSEHPASNTVLVTAIDKQRLW